MSARKPIVFTADDPALRAPAPTFDPAPVEPDAPPPPPKRSALAAVFWAAVGLTISLGLSLAAYEFTVGLMAVHPMLGWAGVALCAIIGVGLLVFALRELTTLLRMRRLDDLRAEAALAWDTLDKRRAQAVATEITSLYRGRDGFAARADRIAALERDQADADALLTLIEREALADADAAALDAVKRAARSVAGATAVLPAGLLDAAAVLYLNVRMVRAVAESYGGRAGWVGSWRLLRHVTLHLATTGAIALGDDLLGAVIGGGALARLSRRAGEGLLNGALTARVGIAAIDVSRPMPFRAVDAPSVRTVAKAALSGTAKAATKS